MSLILNLCWGALTKSWGIKKFGSVRLPHFQSKIQVTNFFLQHQLHRFVFCVQLDGKDNNICIPDTQNYWILFLLG